VDEPGQERLNEMGHRLQAESHLTVLQISHDHASVSRVAPRTLCLNCDHDEGQALYHEH